MPPSWTSLSLPFATNGGMRNASDAQIVRDSLPKRAMLEMETHTAGMTFTGKI